MEGSENITALLSRWKQGDDDSFNELFPLIYKELLKSAYGRLNRFSGVDTISPTVLVHEVFLKLIDQSNVEWKDRNHLMAVAATAMRHILINYAQAKQCSKRGGNWLRVTYNEAGLDQPLREEQLLALDSALESLAASEPRLAKVVEMRFFGGLTEGEIAAVLSISERTARRDWTKAKALLSLTMNVPKAATRLELQSAFV